MKKEIKIEKVTLSAATSRIELILAQMYYWFTQAEAKARQIVNADDVSMTFKQKTYISNLFKNISTGLDIIFNRSHFSGTEKLDKLSSVLQFKGDFSELMEGIKNVLGKDLSEFTIEVPPVDEQSYKDVQDRTILEDVLKPLVKEIKYKE